MLDTAITYLPSTPASASVRGRDFGAGEKINTLSVSLSQTKEELNILTSQFENAFGVPEVPGSYYTPRHVVNAARKIVNEQDDCRETLIDYTRKINEELNRKRQEFNLPIEE